MAYPYIPGANTDAFKGVSVFVGVFIGLVVSLGSAGVVGQIIGGLFVTFSRALRPGDVVHVGDIHGVVKKLGLVSVIVSTPTQEEVTIGYNTPWRQVRAMLLLAAARTKGISSEPTPVVHETALSNFYVEYELVAHGDVTVSRPVLMSRLHEQILDVFNEHGVQIMSPSFEAQPEQPAIVDRSQWFAEPPEKADARMSSR